MFVPGTVRTGDVIRIRSLHVSRPTLFFEVEVLASQVKPDLSSYGYVLPRQAHCETAQLHCGRLIARPHLPIIPYLLFVSVAANDNAQCWGHHCEWVRRYRPFKTLNLMFKPSVILLEYTDQLREIDHGGATRRSPRIPQLRQWFTINRLSVDYGNNYGLRS